MSATGPWPGCGGEYSIAELCRREGLAESLYYAWSKEFLEAGKKRLAKRLAALLPSHTTYVEPFAGSAAPTGTAVPKVQPPLSESLTALPAVNLAALDAAIVIGAPVWGLRP